MRKVFRGVTFAYEGPFVNIDFADPNLDHEEEFGEFMDNGKTYTVTIEPEED